MQSGHFAGALRRRKLFVAIGLLATAGMAVFAGFVVQPTYSAHAVVVLVPPLPGDGVRNPYLYLGGLIQARDVAQRAMTSQAVESEISQQEPEASFSVAVDPSSGPLLDITAEAPTAEGALNTMDALVERAPVALKSLQDRLGVAKEAQIKAFAVTADKEATLVRKTQIRAVIAATGLGLGATVLGVGLLDGLLARHRGRRSPQDQIPGPWPPADEGRSGVFQQGEPPPGRAAESRAGALKG